MTIEEMLSMPTLHATKPQARYLLHAVHPVTGQTMDSRYLSMRATLAEAAGLLEAGHCIEIWSSSSLEARARVRPAMRRHRPKGDGPQGTGIAYSRRSSWR